MKKRVHAFYAGHVQGVGFRLTAEELAKELEVAGWVKNLRDGRVELVAEGAEPVLVRFLEQLRKGPMRNFISDVEVSWSASTDNCEEFEIRYF